MTGSKFIIAAVLCATTLLGACQQQGTAPPAPAVKLDQAWARTTHPGARTGAGYLVITTARADGLVSVESPAAEKVELHESALDGMVMTMRPLGELALEGDKPVTLAPGGKHMMFVGLKKPFVAGERVPVTMTFRNAGPQTVELEVRNAPPEPGHAH